MNRRKFVKNTISFTALIALHKVAQSCESWTNTETTAQLVNARFPEITLNTSKLKEQLHFYSKVLGIPVIDSDDKQFSLKIGASILRFKEVNNGFNPTYHFAFNIPSNKFKKAKKWLSTKTPLLGNGLYYFDFWDAHAMYFRDPAGNIGELIARHTLDNDREGEFGITDLLCVSEIGTPVRNPSDFASELKKAYNLDAYAESMFIGDENGIFVVVPKGRLWYPDYILEAEVYPIDILISDEGVDELKYKKYPYSIKRKK